MTQNNSKLLVSRANKKIKKDWEEEILECHPLMTKVLKVGRNDTMLECIFCSKTNSSYSIFTKAHTPNHLTTKYHKKALNDDNLNNQLIEAVNKIKYEGQKPLEAQSKDVNQDIDAKESSKLLKFKLSKFLVDNQLPYSLIVNLIELIHNVNTEFADDVIQNTNCSRPAATQIITKCISAAIKEEVFQEMTSSPYSLAIDECSDVYGSSYFSVCAKYIKPNQREPVTKLVSVIQLTDSQTGEYLYNTLKKAVLSKHSHLEKNLIAVVTDQGRNMSSQNKGLMGRLQKDYPYIITCNDLSHKYNLISKHASSYLPNNVIPIIKSISSHFNYSSLRRNKLRSVQIYQKKEPLAVPTYCDTRWLSLYECLERIIYIWDSLNVYYNYYGDEDEKNTLQRRVN